MLTITFNVLNLSLLDSLKSKKVDLATFMPDDKERKDKKIGFKMFYKVNAMGKGALG